MRTSAAALNASASVGTTRVSAATSASAKPSGCAVTHEEYTQSISPMTPSGAKRLMMATYSVMARGPKIPQDRKLGFGFGRDAPAQQALPGLQQPEERTCTPACVGPARFASDLPVSEAQRRREPRVRRGSRRAGA